MTEFRLVETWSGKVLLIDAMDLISGFFMRVNQDDLGTQIMLCDCDQNIDINVHNFHKNEVTGTEMNWSYQVSIEKFPVLSEEDKTVSRAVVITQGKLRMKLYIEIDYNELDEDRFILNGIEISPESLVKHWSERFHKQLTKEDEPA